MIRYIVIQQPPGRLYSRAFQGQSALERGPQTGCAGFNLAQLWSRAAGTATTDSERTPLKREQPTKEHPGHHCAPQRALSELLFAAPKKNGFVVAVRFSLMPLHWPKRRPGHRPVRQEVATLRSPRKEGQGGGEERRKGGKQRGTRCMRSAKRDGEGRSGFPFLFFFFMYASTTVYTVTLCLYVHIVLHTVTLRLYVDIVSGTRFTFVPTIHS